MRICDNLDEKGVYQNDTLDGPAVNKDGSLADQDKIRLEVHEGMVERKKQCHIYKGEKYCYCEENGIKKDSCVPWAEAVLKQIERVEKDKDNKYSRVRKMLEDGRAMGELIEEAKAKEKNK